MFIILLTKTKLYTLDIISIEQIEPQLLQQYPNLQKWMIKIQLQFASSRADVTVPLRSPDLPIPCSTCRVLYELYFPKMFSPPCCDIDLYPSCIFSFFLPLIQDKVVQGEFFLPI